MEPVEYLRGIRRRWRVILAAVVISMAVAFFTSAALPASQDDDEQFEASVLLLDARGSRFGVATRGTQGVSLDTIAIFATLDDVAERAAERLHSRSGAQRPGRIDRCLRGHRDGHPRPSRPPLRRGARAERVAKAFALSLTDYLSDQRRGDLQRQIKVLERAGRGTAGRRPSGDRRPARTW